VPYAVQQLLVQAMSQLQQLGTGNRFSLQLGVLPDDAQGPAGESECHYTERMWCPAHCLRIGRASQLCAASQVELVRLWIVCGVRKVFATPSGCSLCEHCAGSGALVVFDASTGTVLLGPSVLKALHSTPVHVLSAAVQATGAAAQRLVHAAGQVGS
jgi:hypothetical protein